jgi:uncharacterized protein with NAD-binding domain and iron-sulfur cluster
MPKVIILGGGVAGMSAAHELIERGFGVEVYERNPEYAGGKARSVEVPGTNLKNPDKYLPGEHGFRFFPGFYKHVTDTMKRIPLADGRSCFDNLVPTETVKITQIGDLPITLPVQFPGSFRDVVDLFLDFMQVKAELKQEELDFFAGRIWQLMTSCSERFLNQYEQIGWWEFLEADRFSDAYRALLVEGLTRSLVAAKAQTASTRTVGTIFLQLLYLMIRPGADADLVLNNPTNLAWIDPWLAYLKRSGVRYFHGATVAGIHMDESYTSIASISIEKAGSDEVEWVTGDYYILATPLEVAAQLINPAMLRADASLKNIMDLSPNVEWMNGIQFYLSESFDMHRGHTIYSGSNWALTSISQIQFWKGYDLSERLDGTVKGVLSVDISDWKAPGNFNGKAARDCTLEEVKEEVWKQLKQEINGQGAEILRDDMLRFVYLDSDIHAPDQVSSLFQASLPKTEAKRVQSLLNKEPLLVNQVNTWTLRPNAFTGIPNLFLASDYVKTFTDLATMEGANEAARRAVNNIIRASGKDADLCELWKLDEPLALDLFQLLDRKRWNQGLAWRNPV